MGTLTAGRDIQYYYQSRFRVCFFVTELEVDEPCPTRVAFPQKNSREMTSWEARLCACTTAWATCPMRTF
eukprot:2181502-Pyramimonas_sp.AAC.1